MSDYQISQHRNPSLDFLNRKARPTIGLDLDGVSARTREYFISRIEDQHDIEIPRSRLTQSNPHIPEADTSYSDEVEKVVENDVELYKSIQPIPGAARATRTLSIFYDVDIVTHRVRDGWLSKERHKRMKETTVSWLQENGFSFNEFVDPTPEDKTHTNAQVYIDDKVSNIERTIDRDDRVGILFLRPHNTNFIPDGAWVASAEVDTSYESMARSPQRQWSIITEALKDAN